jgi:RimJ/RimL family protein N-acetyltransferase
VVRVVAIADKDRIREFLRQDPDLHIYELGDLDDFFWRDTRWFALEDGDAIAAIALLYTAPAVPVVVVLGAGEPPRTLLGELRERLPSRIYAHLSPGVAGALAPRFSDELRSTNAKLALVDRDALARADASRAVRMAPADTRRLEEFYARAYPANWFDPRMLETGHYFAICDGDAIIAAGGVHVYSASERVAALGNIAVDPEMRGRGLGGAVTAAVCRSLLPTVDRIGLNVVADNRAAIACYERLGFRHVAAYEEHRFTAPRFFTADYVERVVLRDGTAVRLRLLAPEDKALLRKGFERLSSESRYARFLVPKVTLSTEELRYLTEIDQEDHFALGAVREDGDGHGDPIGLGIARFIRTGPTSAEAAIAVSDEVQGQGLGRLMFLRLVAAAAERGIDRFHCEVLCHNASMKELIRGIAPDYAVEVSSGVMSIEFALPVVSPTEPPPPAHGAMYRFFKAAAGNAVEWTEAVRRFWRR